MTTAVSRRRGAADPTYAGYLQLDTILTAQHPRSADPNEWLFIIQHQTSELWLKLALIELAGARSAIRADRLPQAFKMLARVSRVFEQLVHAWDVLATMTPSEYSALRPHLGRSSGLQSLQYRRLELLLGQRPPGLLARYAGQPAAQAELRRAAAEPSLYDEAIAALARRGFAVGGAPRAGRPRRYSKAVEQAWLAVYRQPEAHWGLYELAEELVDLEDAFRQWRFRHVTTVERIIGRKRGTGGTNGVGYLRRRLDVVLFPELWQLRTDL